MVAQTTAERQAAFRLKRAETPEVRGIFAQPADHPAIKESAEKISKRRAKAKKKAGLAPVGE